eukprot:gnl/TRDRNA2_/TRDRNA2_177694_c1_seq2.p1 gnl/TRDRNA2_/TRDRNA2_177694_c1~~gnl/TRDRNA2_/TRDRNA2_177694_c1_seq2.p1  ORF type:complete len:300 (-),score=-25.27 gnl/TRDRNA2_/TRDRNA2_177694_c1_seq2:391-1290(-)
MHYSIVIQQKLEKNHNFSLLNYLKVFYSKKEESTCNNIQTIKCKHDFESYWKFLVTGMDKKHDSNILCRRYESLGRMFGFSSDFLMRRYSSNIQTSQSHMMKSFINVKGNSFQRSSRIDERIAIMKRMWDMNKEICYELVPTCFSYVICCKKKTFNMSPNFIVKSDKIPKKSERFFLHIQNLVTGLNNPIVNRIIKKSKIKIYKNGKVENEIVILYSQHYQKILFGRAPDCEIIVAHPSITAKHAQLSIDSVGSLYLTDLNSSHGSSINGLWIKPKSPHGVYVGSSIKLGSCSQTYVIC